MATPRDSRVSKPGNAVIRCRPAARTGCPARPAPCWGSLALGQGPYAMGPPEAVAGVDVQPRPPISSPTLDQRLVGIHVAEGAVALCFLPDGKLTYVEYRGDVFMGE